MKPHITKTKEGWQCAGGPCLKYKESGRSPKEAYAKWVKLINFVYHITKREVLRDWAES